MRLPPWHFAQAPRFDSHNGCSTHLGDAQAFFNPTLGVDIDNEDLKCSVNLRLLPFDTPLGTAELLGSSDLPRGLQT